MLSPGYSSCSEVLLSIMSGVLLSLMTIFSSLSQSPKLLCRMLMPVPKLTVFKFLHPAKTVYPSFVTLSGISIASSLLQCAKALFPIFVIEEGITNSFSDEHL